MFVGSNNVKRKNMRIIDFVKVLTLCILVPVMTSCGDDVVYETIQNTDEGLCAHTWTETYEMTNEENLAVTCVHQLKFAKLDYSGQEIYEYYYVGQSRPYSSLTRNFDWEWMDSAKEGLRLDFGAGNIVYFENVWVREHYLSGKLDGVEVTFADADYK